MKVLILCIFFLVLIEGMRSRAGARKRLLQTRENERYYDAYNELIMSVRERQHDLDNHISAILGMIYTIDNYEELARRQSEYCHELMDRSDKARLLLSVPHRLIAGFLSVKIEEAYKYDIQVEYHVAVDESKLKIPGYELIDILGVLFDNALRALEGGTSVFPLIRLEISDGENEIRISLAKTSKVFSPEEILLFFQKDTAGKGEGHGIGLKKLKKTVHKLGGEIMVSNEQIRGVNYLQFTVVIPEQK